MAVLGHIIQMSYPREGLYYLYLLISYFYYLIY